MSGPEVRLIAAMDRHRVIGKNGDLPWRLPDDLRRFKTLTRGHAVIMGRKTYESIGRPLPDRVNVVLTRRPDWRAEGVEVASGVEDALERLGEEEEVFVIGGEGVYAGFLGRADRLHLTRVDTAVEGGDVHFPDWSPERFRLMSREEHAADGRHLFAFAFEDYARID